MKTLKEALKRIEELEIRITMLEARPLQVQEHHFHHHYPQPYYVQPTFPAQWIPAWWQPTWTITSGTDCISMKMDYGNG